MSQIRNNPGTSSYFKGGYRGYGRYQWNVKYNGYEHECELELAQQFALGDHVKATTRSDNGNTVYGFERISELLGRPIKSSLEGRSGGWLVIDTELTDDELARVDEYVKECLKALPEFLKDEREYRLSEIVTLGGASEGE